MRLRLVYFAWIRERIGKEGEELDLPEGVRTVADLIAHLKGLGEEYAAALEFPEIVRAAIDEELAEPDEFIAGARAIALFPPMTGG